MVSDRKDLDTPPSGELEGTTLSAHVLSYTNYYPFGMPQPGRALSGAEGYRYGFQARPERSRRGQEMRSIHRTPLKKKVM